MIKIWEISQKPRTQVHMSWIKQLRDLEKCWIGSKCWLNCALSILPSSSPRIYPFFLSSKTISSWSTLEVELQFRSLGQFNKSTKQNNNSWKGTECSTRKSFSTLIVFRRKYLARKKEMWLLRFFLVKRSERFEFTFIILHLNNSSKGRYSSWIVLIQVCEQYSIDFVGICKKLGCTTCIIGPKGSQSAKSLINMK